MDYCEGGELLTFISDEDGLSEKQTATIIHQAMYALSYLHVNKICHRDIKPENFLLFKKGDINHIKMIDFGLAVKKKDPKEEMHTLAGSPFYIAPEVLKGQYTISCDNWSMGVLMYVMLAGKYPFSKNEDQDMEDLFENIKTAKYDLESEFWNEISESAKDLIRKLLERDTDKRLTALEAMNHEWMKNAKEEKMKSFRLGSR
jgi:calcium-dependent protein kinase